MPTPFASKGANTTELWPTAAAPWNQDWPTLQPTVLLTSCSWNKLASASHTPTSTPLEGA